MFLVIFVVAFACGFLLIRSGTPPTAAGLAATGERAHGGDSLAKGKASAPTSASEPDKVETQSAPSAETRDAEKDSSKPVAASNPVKGSARQPGQPKRIVVRSNPETPKEPKTNGGIPDQDLDRLQGTWQVVDTEYDGNRLAEEARKYSWEFRGDKYTIKHQGNFTERWAVQLNSGTNPKTINSTHDIVGKQFKGIYEVTNDTLKVCYDLTGNGRPDSFKATKGSRRVCYYFKRSN
jgi:uncharacterized protein (TIGR03067 family)